VWEAAEPFVVSEKQVAIEAWELDKANMYDLHVGATKKILEELNWREMDEVYVEQIGGMHEKKFYERIQMEPAGFIYEPKADVKYVPVSLASIKAKIVRDRILMKLCGELDEEYVSGYPNSVTEEFLRRCYEKHGKLPKHTRVSRKWAPIEEMLNKGDDGRADESTDYEQGVFWSS
jgi:ribonuclease HII